MFSLNVIIKSRSEKRAGHAADMGQKINADTFLTIKHSRKGPVPHYRLKWKG